MYELLAIHFLFILYFISTSRIGAFCLRKITDNILIKIHCLTELNLSVSLATYCNNRKCKHCKFLYFQDIQTVQMNIPSKDKHI